MGELALEQFPQENKQPTPPEIKFINKLNALETEKKEIEEKIATADEEERKFLQLSYDDINKRIQGIHDSFGVYRTKKKYRELDEAVKEQLGEGFVDDFRRFKNNPTRMAEKKN